MHIYLYLSHFPPKGDKLNEGLTKAVHGLASGFVACGAQVTVLSEAFAPDDSIYETQAGYTIRCFPNPIHYRPSFKTSAGLKQYILEHLDRNSLVILNGILHANVYSMSRLLRKYGVSYVIAPHDVYHPVMFRKNAHLKWTYWYLLEKRMLKQAKAIQILEISQGKWLRKLGVNTQFVETPNGYSSNDIFLESELEYKENKAIEIFYFGRIDAHHKGLDLLIEAFAQISQVSNANLTIQGPDDGDKKILENKATELIASKRVSFLGPAYDKSPPLIIANYDIFCLPSRFEGFGLSALEAMLAARVLLVSETAGIAAHVRASGCGVVVAPEISKIKSGLIELIQRRSEWKEMGLRGRNYALEHLRWDKIAAETFAKYEKLVR